MEMPLGLQEFGNKVMVRQIASKVLPFIQIGAWMSALTAIPTTVEKFLSKSQPRTAGAG